MAFHKICKYLWYPQMFSFLWLSTWRQTFLVFYFYPVRHADFINGLQYRVAKMYAKCMQAYAKYGHEINFWEKYDFKKQVINKNCTINEPKMVYFQDAFIDLGNKFLLMTWTWCMPGDKWILGYIWPKKNMVTQYQPRAMIFVLTW